MVLGKVFERFVQFTPVSVMMRGVLENVFAKGSLDELFVQTAKRQCHRKLLFSAVVDLLSLVVAGVRKSVHEAYEAAREEFTVAVQSVYNKLNRVEPEVSRELVRRTAGRLARVVRQLIPKEQRCWRGFRVKIIDGNHFPSTEHRLKVTRTTRSGPLPGQALVVLEPALMLATDVFPCEDGHAQERSLLPKVLETVQAEDLWIADRNFCTTDFLFGIAQRQGYFLIRQHASTLTCELLGERRRVGRCETGMVYEQGMRLSHPDGRQLTIRRITIELDEPTRDGETAIHLLTNASKRRLPAKVAAEKYRQRWTVENAFQELSQALHSEINTLGYPKAAVLSFSISLMTYNAMSVVKTALAAAHPDKVERKHLSGYYLASEISAAYYGMMIAIPESKWTKEFADLSGVQLARLLRQLATGLRIERFMKRYRSPKKPRPKRTSGRRYHHVSTARLLAQQKTQQQ
ncbi:MAG: IS4 family transposase [Planctomycetota bacterium]